jgi:predicted AlkP superfamily phosphohydrolase/phosphomutase
VSGPRVLIIGLDGASWRVVRPWAEAGKLPALASLMQRGTWGVLRSTSPALTLPAWASFMTGKNPGGHGVYGFRRLAPDRYDGAGLANATDLRTATIWDVAAAAGRRVGVVNVPPSYPIRPIPNGFVVGCMLTPPGQPFTDPPELASELGEYEIDTPALKNLRRTDPDYRSRSLAYLRGLERQTRLRSLASVRVATRRPVDALCVVFYAPDRLQHYFWNYVDPSATTERDPELDQAVHAVYRELDRSVARLLEAAGPETAVIVLSDHGFTNKPERSVRINRWLADHGHLRRHAFWTLRRRVIRKLLPEPWRGRYDTTDHILVDRARSRAWAESLFTGSAGIWIHVRGRYPHGCVAPGAEYEAVRGEIQRGLAGLHDEDGHPVFSGVFRREELYSGPFVDEAPDLVAECHPRFGILFESLRRELKDPNLFGPFEELGYTGTHEADGLYILAGGPFAARNEGAAHPIEAIAPTVLYALGVPIPSDMEAEPCLDAVRDDFRAAHPVERSEPLEVHRSDGQGAWRSGTDEAKVAEHLRALGYLE